MKVKILWSGITGRTGVLAKKLAKSTDFAEIVGGLSRTDKRYFSYDSLDQIDEDFDVIVDFSHKDSFDKVLNFALCRKKPLVSGTSGISDEMLEKLEKASHEIPIFRGGNFRTEIEKFIGAVVEYSKTHDDLRLIETHYKTKKIPSETAKVIKKRVFEATGKEVVIESRLKYNALINDYKIGNLHARVNGFKPLATDVLKIAYVMKTKSANGLYDLRQISEEVEKVK